MGFSAGQPGGLLSGIGRAFALGYHFIGLGATKPSVLLFQQFQEVPLDNYSIWNLRQPFGALQWLVLAHRSSFPDPEHAPWRTLNTSSLHDF